MGTTKTGSSRYPGVRWRETSKGKVYEARWRDADGRSQGKSGFVSAKDAADYLHDKREQLRKGNYVSPTMERTNWRTVADSWLTAKQAQGRKPRTLQGYERVLKQHFSRWDNRPIGRLTPEDVTALLGRLHRAGLGTQTRHNVFNVASSVFDYAERHRMITSNPARVVREDLPSRAAALQDAKERVVFLNPTQITRLADAVRETAVAADKRKGVRVNELAADGDALPVRFAAWSGLRSGEIAGLRLRAVDELRSEVRVEEAVTRHKDAGLVAGTPKTKRSRRRVPLPPALVKELLDYANRCGLGHDDYVFGGKTPRDMSNYYRRRFLPAAKKAGLQGVRMHDLRHTFASLMAHHGHKGHEVSAWMGHSSVSFTLDFYTHLFHDETAHAARAAKLDAAYLAGCEAEAAPVASITR